MEDEIKIRKLSESTRRWIRMICVIVFLALLFYAGILLGMDSTCKKSQGKLLSDGTCVIVDNLDYCKDEITGFVHETAVLI